MYSCIVKKNTLKIITLFVMVLFLSGWKSVDIDNTAYEGSDVLGVTFIQQERPVSLVKGKNGAEVKVKAEPFNILVPSMNSSIAVQICAFKDIKVFEQFAYNMQLKDIPCYSLGTGMAVSSKSADKRFNLYLTSGNAHNYFHNSRSTNGEKYRSIGIDAIIEQRDAAKRPDYNEFYMVIYMDKNNNKVMDRDEIEYFYFPERGSY